MVPADQLQIDIFVTKAKPRPPPEKTEDQDDLALPKPSFAQGGIGGRTGSTDSLSSMMSQDHLMHSTHGDDDMVDAHLEESYADIIDLTNFEDEEDNDDPNDTILSNRIQQQGKLRRARTRKTIRREARNAAKGRSHVAGPEITPPEITVLDEEGDEITEAPFDPYDPFSSARIRAHSPTPSKGYDIEDDEDRHHTYSHGQGHAHLHQRKHSHGHGSKARPNTMVLLETGNLDPQGDAAIWIDSADYEAMQELSEMARPGKPKLAQVLEEEIELAGGSIIVGSESIRCPRPRPPTRYLPEYTEFPNGCLTDAIACGPVTLNTMVRKIVSSHISPGKIRQGDRTGHIALFSEDYE